MRSKGRRFSFTSAPQVGKGIIKVTAWGLEATTPIGNHDARKAPGGYNDSESSLQVYWSDPVARKSVFCSECPVRIVVPKHEAMGKRSTEPEGDVPYWFNFANDGEKFSKWHHGRPLPLPPKPGHVSLVIGTQAYRYMKIRLLDQFGDPLHPLYATPGEARSGPGASSVLYEKFTDAKGVFATEFKDAADSQGRDGWIWMNGWPDAPEHSLEFPSTVLDDNGVAKDVTFFFLVGGMAYVPGNPDIGPTREAARKDRTRNFFADAYEGRVPNVTEKRFIEKYAGTAKQHLCVWGHELSRDSAKTRSIGVWPPPGRKLPYYRVVDE